MAFLDNSGDIILDAVLTDLGRRKMANGNFKIRKFALGDDEINYQQYNLNHPSGSAYYDLEILQTPVLEAVTAENSAINYGLLSITNNNLLYLPSMVTNQKLDHSLRVSGSVFVVCANGETYNVVTGRKDGFTRVIEDNMVTKTSHKETILYFESGIDTLDHTANAANRHNLITSMNMLDTQFTVQADRRMISKVGSIDSSVAISKPADSPDIISQPKELNFGGAGSSGTRSAEIRYYNSYTAGGSNNLLFAPNTADGSDGSDLSALKGPRGSLGGIGFTIHEQLKGTSTAGTPNRYKRFGRVAQTLFGGSQKYDYIDTIVYVQGRSSTATMQLPIRIIRYAGT